MNKTLYIPLYGKAYVSRKGIILNDKKAEEIWAAEGFALGGKSKSKWLAYYMGMRSAVFDNWLRNQHPDVNGSIVLHIGCGMDSRVLRIGIEDLIWYDIDFPDVIRERKRYYTETENYRMIEGDVRSNAWVEGIPKERRAFVIMEGVSMYLKTQELKQLFTLLGGRFTETRILIDCYTSFAARASALRNPINDVGITKVYGMDDPKTLEDGTGFSFVREHEITPKAMTDSLKGTEKAIFKALYAGHISRKMYRLYEYRIKKDAEAPAGAGSP